MFAHELRAVVSLATIITRAHRDVPKASKERDDFRVKGQQADGTNKG